MNKYSDMSDTQKQNFIKQLYEIENKSFQDIAAMVGTYANKIRRDAIKFKIKIKNKSEAQVNALQSGKHKHPTKGTVRNDATKLKIGKSVLKSWDELSENELEQRKSTAKKNWEKLSEDERVHIRQKANQAVRETSKVGSKLEKFILEKLINDGHKVIFHQEQTLANTKLQIDLLIPNMNVAIEIDGPSHFLPVWGDETLKRNIAYDQKKSGLILGKGLVLIRIKQKKDFSKSRADIIYNELKLLLDSISNKFPTIDNRSFTIED